MVTKRGLNRDLKTLDLIALSFGAVVQTVVVLVILLAGVLLITGIGLAGRVEHMEPMFVGLTGIFAAMALVPFIMTGFDVIPQTAEEVDLPPRRIGQLLVVSIVIAVVWYIMIELAAATLLEPQARVDVDLATVSAAEIAFGEAGRVFLLLAGLAGILTSWNSFLIGGSRALFAMAQDGMLPAWLAQVHPTYHTPHRAILLIGLIGVLAPLLGRTSLIWFVNADAFSLMITYLLVAISFVLLRRREPQMPRPFRLTGGRYLGWLGILASLGLAMLYLPCRTAPLWTR